MKRLLTFLSQDTCRVGTLEAFLGTVAELPPLQQECIRLLEQLEPEHLWRALWLLRKTQKAAPLSEQQLERIAESVDEPGFWITRLCLCQLFADTGCPGSLRETLYPFLVRAVEDRRPIIRAWALSALCSFLQDKRYRIQIKRLLKRAQSDPAKSMQARLRRLQAGF